MGWAKNNIVLVCKFSFGIYEQAVISKLVCAVVWCTAGDNNNDVGNKQADKLTGSCVCGSVKVFNEL